MSSLHDLRILVTRPRNQTTEFANLLRSRGAVPICIPVIKIASLSDTSLLDAALMNLKKYDWLVLTSANGVEAMFERLQILGLNTAPEEVRVAAIGPKTAQALEDHGIAPDVVPAEYIAEAILPELGDLKGKRVLLARADIARKTLAEGIRAGGGLADDISAYRTITAEVDETALSELKTGLDVVTFTSSSTVTSFIELIKASDLDYQNLPGNPAFTCIGPITAKTAEENQIPVATVAEVYTTEGLIEAIESLCLSRKAESL